jgi:beta-N-acetylhexosaminidase
VSAPTASSSSARPPTGGPPARGEARRRRRAVLGSLAAVGTAAAIAGAAVGAGGGRDEAKPGDARERAQARRVDPLSLKQRVGQTLMLSFRGTSAPGYVLDVLRERRAAGVVIFRENASSQRQLRALTRRLQRAAGGEALIAADQEGGAIRILSWAAPAEGQAGQADAAAAAAAARATARDLRAAGVNANLAPVVDVGAPGGSAVGGRAFPGDARRVAASATAAVRALGDARVAATVKHFPGFGSAQANTDDEPVTIRAPRERLESRDLEPFRAAIAAGAPLVMSSHALYPALDRRRIASQSPAVLDELLRRRLGFRGAVVTDSLEAEAVLRRSRVDVAAVRSLRAGADLLLMTGPGSFGAVRDRVLATARRDPALRRRVDAAAERVLVVKARLGLERSKAPQGARRAPPAR